MVAIIKHEPTKFGLDTRDAIVIRINGEVCTAYRLDENGFGGLLAFYKKMVELKMFGYKIMIELESGGRLNM